MAEGTTGWSGPYLLMGGYDGANTSPRRGMLYWPSSDTRQEATPMTRAEIRRRVHWLFGNVGIARRLIKGMARLVGYQLPQPDTAAEGWNTEAYESFMTRMASPLLFDTSHKFDFLEGQITMEERAFMDGYILPVLTSSEGGGVQLAFYEASQVVNPPKGRDGWTDGVKVGAQNEHLKYGIRDAADGNTVKEVEAADAMYYGRFESWGEVHPMSVLAHAVNHLVDIVEIRADTKHSIKSTAGKGIVLEQDAAQVVQSGYGGAGGPVVQSQVTLPNGQTQEINWEVVQAGAQTPRLPPGVKAKVISDDRPGPNTVEFERELVADCANGADLPREALFYITGISGPGVRYWMADIRRWIMMKHIRKARWNQRLYATHIAREVQAKRLRACPDPRWWRCTWLGMADPTIDVGRDGNLSIVQLEAGLSTWADEWGGKAGAWWKAKVRQRIREVAFAKLECAVVSGEKEMQANGITVSYAEVFPRRAGAPAGAEESASGADDHEKSRRREAEDDDLPDPKPEDS